MEEKIMGKFFKVFGIGAAIGTLAYGIFKYKHDQKFKEKVDEKTAPAKEKAKKVAENVVEKACIFTVDHPKLVLGGIAAAVVGGSALGGIAVNNKIREIKAVKALNDTYQLEGKELQKHEKWWNDNGYGDNFREVYEFAKDLSLNSDESFGITRYDVDGETVTCVLQEYNDGKQLYHKKEIILKEN
jgi:hypothetical protein